MRELPREPPPLWSRESHQVTETLPRSALMFTERPRVSGEPSTWVVAAHRSRVQGIEQDLDWSEVVLIVLLQGERRDPAESLQLASSMSDFAYNRHDLALTWLRKLGFLEAGAPHFCLTVRGRVMLAALRRVLHARSRTRGRKLGSKRSL